jgi:predicted ATPase
MSEILNNWYVVTGGPSTGKTTMLEEIERNGYKTMPEAARVVIDEGFAAGKTIEEIRGEGEGEKEKQFQDIVMRRKIDVEAGLDPNEVIFLDRGHHDTEAYFIANDFELDNWIVDAIAKAQYKQVFLLDPLPVFEEQEERTESPEKVEQIHKLLFSSYDNANMTPVRVPFMPVKERAEFVLQHID